MSRQRETGEKTSSGDSQRRSADWRRELDRLKTSLSASRPSTGDRYHHSVLWIDGDLPEQLSSIQPRTFASGGRIRRVIPVLLSSGGHLVHFIFDEHLEDDSDEELRLLLRTVRNTQRILQGVPNRLLPHFKHPLLGNGEKENFLTWLSLLHWLGHTEGNSAFRTNVEFLEDKAHLYSRATFTDWSSCSAEPDFDPIPFLTNAITGTKTLAEWKAQHNANGRRFPEVIAASLSKPIWYASTNAIDQILLLDSRSAQSVEKGAVKPGRKGGAKSRTAEKRREGVYQLIQILSEHHRPLEKEKCYIPLDQFQLAESLQVSQPTVSRRMGKLMEEIPVCRGKEPMEAYRDLCDSTEIHPELVRLRIKYFDPELPRLLTRGNFDNHGRKDEEDE